MARLLFTAVCLGLCPAAVSAAALDAQSSKPYQLEVVLHFAEHRLLTPVFKDQVERDLRDYLQAGFGDLATVRVSRPDPADHPRLKEVLDKGLQQALDGWKDVSDGKTHFVLIDYSDGQYDVQTRQYDGLTGQASPVVRRDRTPDRQFVARTAALRVDGDFGLVGTVTDPGDKQTVQLTLKGGGVKDVPLERWVQKGDVFSLVQIGQQGEGYWRLPVRWALLQVQDVQAGVCTCRLWASTKDPLGDRTAAGWRCLKLNTLQTRLRMRLIQSGTRVLTGQANTQVYVQRNGFGKDDATAEQLVTDPDGFFQTEKPYTHAAFVVILGANGAKAQVPVALLDEHVIVCPVKLGADTDLPLYRRRDLWVQRLYETWAVQEQLFKELTAMLGKADRAETLKKAEDGQKNLQSDLESFRREQADLREAAKSLPAGSLDLAKGEQMLKQLEGPVKELQKFIDGLQKTIAKETDPKRKEMQDKLSKAQLLEQNEADYGKAIELYDEVLKSDVDKPEGLAERVAKLKEQWKIKDDNHRRARQYIYETFPKADLVREKSAAAEAQKAFEVCRAAGDRLTPRKLLKVAFEQATRLQKTLAELKPDVNQDDNEAAQTIAKVAEELNKLTREVTDFLR